MNKLKNDTPVGWKLHLTLACIVVSLLTLGSKCNQKPPDQPSQVPPEQVSQVPDPRLQILEEQAKILISAEAQEGFRELFKAAYTARPTRLMVGAELQKWFDEHPKSLRIVPDEIKESIKNNRGVGLLIEGALPGKTGGNHDVVYLRPPVGGIRRFFATADPDPCGDGNPATCERCTGCSGEGPGGGIIHTCVCTQSCDVCRTCRQC